MVLLVLAASSGPVRIWITPPGDVGSPSVDGTGPLNTVALERSVPSDRGGGPPWGALVSQILGALLIVFVVTMVVWFVRSGPWPRTGRRSLRERRRRQITALPEVNECELEVDVDAARVALAGGSARNAIVACWMQLERDAAAAGLPRAAAETSAEYVERVVAASSVDPAPIRELAALYREARFSRHQLLDDHRSRALAAMNRVEAALRRGAEVLA
jgi:hypothetical protein